MGSLIISITQSHHTTCRTGSRTDKIRPLHRFNLLPLHHGTCRSSRDSRIEPQSPVTAYTVHTTQATPTTHTSQAAHSAGKYCVKTYSPNSRSGATV